jgi:hypothetical protein
MTQIIDTFFTGIDASLSKAFLSTKDRQYAWAMNDGTNNYVLVFNYEFKEWFIWASLDMSKGVYQKNNQDIVFAKGTKTYKFNAGYSDEAFAISAYYKANWEDLRVPELDKKFKYVRIWNLNSVATSFSR